MMMSGIIKPRNWLKMPLKVRNALTAASLKKLPKITPNRMAMMILAKSGILILFIFVKLLFVCKGTIFLTFFQVFCCFFRICHAYCTTFMMFEGGHCAMSSCFM